MALHATPTSIKSLLSDRTIPARTMVPLSRQRIRSQLRSTSGATARKSRSAQPDRPVRRSR